MFAEGLAILVEELGVGSLQRPSKLRAVSLAGVDLVALGMDLEKKLFLGGRLDLLWDFLRGGGERKNSACGDEQRGGNESANVIGHGTFPPKGTSLGWKRSVSQLAVIGRRG